MNGETRLIDTNVLVQAYTVSDDRKHGIALAVVERIWKGEGAATTVQNLCEFFFVVTRKVTRPISAAAAETIVTGILRASQWTFIDRRTETVLKAMEFVRQRRVPFGMPSSPPACSRTISESSLLRTRQTLSGFPALRS